MPRKKSPKKSRLKASKGMQLPHWTKKPAIRFFAAVAVLFVLFAAKTQADAQVVVNEESVFTWSSTTGLATVTDSTASGGKAVKLTKNLTGSVTNTTGEALTNLTVTAKGDQCKAAPIMQVTLDGTVIANETVSATSWTNYSYEINAPAGTHQLQIGFTNSYTSVWLGAVQCVRGLYLDKATYTVVSPDTSPSPSPSESPEPSPSPSPSPSTLPLGAQYVAMGDSYSSGWGADRTPSNLTRDTSVYDTSKCKHNTKYGSQYLLAREMGLTLTDVSCGGTSTRHILTVSYQNQPPQIKAVKSDTSLVTFTIGGNETGLLYLLTMCIKTTGTCNPNGTTSKDVDEATAELPINLNKIYQQVADTAPTAKLRHAGYPLIIAAPGEPTGTCKSWLNASDQQLFYNKLTAVNNTIRQTIEAFAARTGRDFKYVDPLAPNSPFMQRENGQMLDGCSTSLNRYMNGTNDGALQYGGWHPNIYGQQYYEQIYKASL